MRFVLLMGLLAAVAGCSGDESSGTTGGTGATGGAGGSGGGAGAAGSAGASGSAPECPGPGYHDSATPTLISGVTGRVVDLTGTPLGNISATVCGTDICIYGSTNAQGDVVSNCDEFGVCSTGISPNQEIRKPAFKYALGMTHVQWAYLLPPGATHDVGDMPTAALPDVATGAEMVPGSDATSSGVTLSLLADTYVKIDKLTYENEQHWKFRAVEIPVASAPPAVDTSAGFVMLVGTTPVHTTFCPAAKLSVPNTPGLPAGTEVELWMHGVDPAEEWAPYGGWAKVSDAAVSADGSMIVTADGQGIPELSVFGIKQK